MKTLQEYEYFRQQANQKFELIKPTMLDCLKWAAPWRGKWLNSERNGNRNNQHIVEGTHILAHRSYVAGFLEGNTSAARPWYRLQNRSEDKNSRFVNKQWQQKYTNSTLNILGRSNFYHAAGLLYYDLGGVNTGAYWIDETKAGLYFHNLIPGSYKVINNSMGEAVMMVREMSLTVKALVDRYGKKDKNGAAIWSNFSNRVKNLYTIGNYTDMIDIVCICHLNEDFDPDRPQILLNRKWLACTYELGTGSGQYYQEGQEFGVNPDIQGKDVFLLKSAFKRKPFIVAKSHSNANYEYGEQGPTLDSLGIIKSLNKKVIAKDQALDQMLKPALQGPANLKKSYITTQSNSYVPLDPTSLSQKGLRPVFDVNPAIAPLLQDQGDLRQQVNEFYYANFLLYLIQNPKTRTATETDAILKEQQLVIGPNLQSLNISHNIPVIEYVADYALDEDPNLEDPPPDIAGDFIKIDLISVFAQAQKAADIPSIDRATAMIKEIGQIPGGEKIWDKLNLDKLADLYEDRLYLPAGLINPQSKVDAMREQALAMQQRQQMLEQTLPAVAGASKDLGIQAQQQK